MLIPFQKPVDTNLIKLWKEYERKIDSRVDPRLAEMWGLLCPFSWAIIDSQLIRVNNILIICRLQTEGMKSGC